MSRYNIFRVNMPIPLFRAWIAAIFLVSLAIPSRPIRPRTSDTPALETAINAPAELAVDGNDHLYVVEGEYEHKVDQINLTSGTIRNVAGSGQECCFQEGALATSVSLGFVTALATDRTGNIYVGNMDGFVRKVDVVDWRVTTVAGSDVSQHVEVGAHALATSFGRITALAISDAGDMYISDGATVYKIGASTQIVSRVAGTGKSGFGGDGGPAADAKFGDVRGITFDSRGNLYVSDSDNCRIRRVDALTAVITTVALTEESAKSGRCTTSNSFTSVPEPEAIVTDAHGNVYCIIPSYDFVVRLDADTLALTKFAGNGDRGFSGDGGPAALAELANPSGLAIDSSGNLFVSEFVNNRIRRIDAKTKIITTIAGNGLPQRMDPQL